MQTWSGCGGTAVRNVQLAISPADQSATLHIEVQLPDDDNSPLQAVLSSLPTVPASTMPASTMPASTVPASTMPASTVPTSTVPASATACLDYACLDYACLDGACLDCLHLDDAA